MHSLFVTMFHSYDVKHRYLPRKNMDPLSAPSSNALCYLESRILGIPHSIVSKQ